MEKVSHEGSEYDAINMATSPGAAALHGLKQLIRELEPLIGSEAAERVRTAVEVPINASDFPEKIKTALMHGLR